MEEKTEDGGMGRLAVGSLSKIGESDTPTPPSRLLAGEKNKPTRIRPHGRTQTRPRSRANSIGLD